ncbi:MAG: molybdopterin molybdenumtransferase MoeA [Ponticaulis sp.]|nr:molybdopterin molybdenumtransferase MoeA [Ponticaulis sp.]
MSGLISVDDALGLLEEHATHRAVELVPLSKGFGRTLAEDVLAKTTQPASPVSAMDGYAVNLEDVRTPEARLKVIGESPAGHPFPHPVDRGECVRIFTGGYLPEGTNHIVIQENAERDADEMISLQGYDAPLHVRAAGRDFHAGQLLIRKHTRLHAGGLALLAAANIDQVSVYRQLRVGILANGDELKPVGSELQPGEIVNSNPIGLSALIREGGGEPIDLGIASDSVDAITEKISASPDIDIFVPVGGASVGDHDHMKPAFTSSGFELVFSKIAVKPGKPTWFGRTERSLVLGLPGNPASAFVCAQVFLKPLITGHFEDPGITAMLSGAVPENGGRESFLRSRLSVSSEGQLNVSPHGDQDSSLISPFLECSALIRRAPHAPAARTGDVLPIRILASDIPLMSR